jgi:hypothetical protein
MAPRTLGDIAFGPFGHTAWQWRFARPSPPSRPDPESGQRPPAPRAAASRPPAGVPLPSVPAAAAEKDSALSASGMAPPVSCRVAFGLTPQAISIIINSMSRWARAPKPAEPTGGQCPST